MEDSRAREDGSPDGDHSRKASSPEALALPGRAVRGGVQIGIRVARRTVAHTRPTAGSRMQQLLASLVFIPLLVVVLTAMAVLFVALLFVLVVVATALALTAFVVRRRLRRAS
jgi:Flp pilus assembly protein TadB